MADAVSIIDRIVGWLERRDDAKRIEWWYEFFLKRMPDDPTEARRMAREMVYAADAFADEMMGDRDEADPH